MMIRLPELEHLSGMFFNFMHLRILSESQYLAGSHSWEALQMYRSTAMRSLSLWTAGRARECGTLPIYMQPVGKEALFAPDNAVVRFHLGTLDY